MDNKLNHLPEKKQKEIDTIVSSIKEKNGVGLIILFGSHARGDWVSDRYTEGHVTYEYESDYDILVVVESDDVKNNLSTWRDVENELAQRIKVTVNLIVDTIHFVNKKLSESNYFYLDIKNEGIVLYDSGKLNLSSPSMENQFDNAQKDYNFWYQKAKSFYKDYQHNITDNELNNAAFHLSQVTEALYFAILLVFTGYKPKSHNIEKISQLAEELAPGLVNVFPKESDEEREMFDLLKKAYIEARYKQDYMIKKDQLTYLEDRIKILFNKVKLVCENKLTSLSQ